MEKGNKFLKLLSRLHHEEALNSILAKDTLFHLLNRECKRTDRTGREFSLAVFFIRENNGKENVFRLIKTIKNRVRSTDDVGWLDPIRIGVILPETCANDAKSLSDQICKKIGPHAAIYSPQVYTYPSWWLPHNKNNNTPQNYKHSKTTDIETSGNIQMIEELATKTVRHNANPPQSSGELGVNETEGLEPFLLCRLPTWKRSLDLFAAITGILILSPLMLLITMAVKLTSQGPTLYIQERTGQNLVRFKMLKFRTMVDGADKQIAGIKHMNEMTGPLIKMNKDPRLTRVGQILRRTSLDELPQLFNVLKGDMTIIGPRALSPLPSKYESWQLRRFVVKPGIACTWQAERRAETEFKEWMRSDLRYVQGNTFWTDIFVLVKTLLIVARCKGSR